MKGSAAEGSRGSRFLAMGSGKSGASSGTPNCWGKRAAGRHHHDTRHGPQERQVFRRDQIRAAQIDSPGPVHPRVGRMGLDQVFELLTQRLLIAAGLLVQDHQVGHEPVHAPVGMRLEHLTDQAEILHLADGDQGNRQVTRDGIGPQAGLPFAVFRDAFCGGTQQGIGIQQMAGQLLEAARFVGLDAQQAQLKLGRGPGEIHRPIDRTGIAILIHQTQDLFA